MVIGCKADSSTLCVPDRDCCTRRAQDKQQPPSHREHCKLARTDCLQWCDHSNYNNLRSPDFKLNLSKESSWIHGWYTPCCGQEEPRRGLQAFMRLPGEEGKEEEEEREDYCVEKNRSRTDQRNNIRSQEDEEQEAFFFSNQQNMPEDASQTHAFLTLLKACARQKDLHRGSKLHADIVKAGLLQENVYLGSTLVSMYAKCGSLAKAKEVFDKLPVRNVVSWNALIAGYVQHGHGEQAFEYFQQMQLQGFPPNVVTYICILKACGSIRAVDKGEELHAEIARKGFLGKGNVLETVLVDMYAKCGLLEKAKEVFDKLSARDVVSWSALIAGYVEHGYDEHALECLEQMQLEGFTPNAVTFICILKACGRIRAADKGKDLHAVIVREALLEKDIAIGTSLVDMYAKCGLLAEAQDVFDKLPFLDVVLWNTLMAGYVQHGHGEEALEVFGRMQFENLSPNAVTYVCVLKACGITRAAEKGKGIHAEIVCEGLLDKDVTVGNALVDMYAKCGLLDRAQEVFDKLPLLDVVSWNGLMTGYAQHGHNEQVLKCLVQMQQKGTSPNAITYVCFLQACGSIGAVEKGEEIHVEIDRKGLLKEDIVVGNALVDMYAKCGLLAKAQEEFDRLPFWDVISWNVLMSGYAQHGHGEQVLKCLDQMQLQGFFPNSITYVCILKACGILGTADKGKEWHTEIIRKGLLEEDIAIGTALVDMYTKCGLLGEAHEVFDKLLVRDLVSWNTVMAGYALLGKAEHVFYLFDQMIEEHITPSSITFTILLKVCSHAGLLAQGQVYFEMMACFGIVPTLEHHTCMVDLFARSGHLDKALAVIKQVPDSVNLTMWLTVLSACQRWGNVTLGRLAFEHAVQLNEKEAASYVCMRNLYAAAGRQEDADKVEAMRVEKQARKMLGYYGSDGSWSPNELWVGRNSHAGLSVQI